MAPKHSRSRSRSHSSRRRSFRRHLVKAVKALKHGSRKYGSRKHSRRHRSVEKM